MADYKALFTENKYRKKRYNAENSDLILEAIWSRWLYDKAPAIGPSERDCYAQAIVRIKENEIKQWESPQGALKTDLANDEDHVLHRYLTTDNRFYYLKAGPWINATPGGDVSGTSQLPFWMKIRVRNREVTPDDLANTSWDGFIDGVENMYLKPQHHAYKAHLPFQQALQTYGNQMMQEWVHAEEPNSWPLPDKYRLVFDAIQVCLDGTIPSRAPASDVSNYTYSGGAQYMFFTYWHREAGATGWEDCWGWRGGYCTNVASVPSKAFTNSPLLMKTFIEKWPIFAQAVSSAQAAIDLKLPSRKLYIDKIIKKLNSSINQIKHAKPSQSRMITKIDDNTEWPRMSTFEPNNWWWVRNDGGWRPAKPGEDAEKLISKIQGPTTNEKAAKWIQKTPDVSPCPSNMFWGYPATVMQHWEKKEAELINFKSMEHDYRAHWTATWDIWRENAPFGKPHKLWHLYLNKSNGILVFNFLNGLDGTNLGKVNAKDYRIYDLIHNADFYNTDYSPITAVPSKDKSHFSVAFEIPQFKKMINEWYAKNPDGKLYLDSVAKTKAEIIDDLPGVYSKLAKHFKKNKGQWDSNFFNPPAPPSLDHTRFDFTEDSGWGSVIEESYERGLLHWFKTYDAYRSTVQQFAPMGTKGHEHRAKKYEYAYRFKKYPEITFDKKSKPVGKRLMHKGDSGAYDPEIHYFNAVDDDEHKKFKDAIEKIFVDQTALAICAWYVGHAKMEYQESFLIEILKKKDKEEKKLDTNALAEAKRDADEDLRGNRITSANQTPGAGALSDEEIEKRQKFFKQCALMLNMEQFVEAHRFRINAEISNKKRKGQSIHTRGNGPYDGRFWMLEDKGGGSGDRIPDQSTIVNKLFISNNLYAFMNIPQAIVAMLVPKIRIYQVYSNGEGSLEECEFEFQQEGLSFPDVNGLTTVADRIEELMSEEFDKGSGAGIKSFSWVYEGTTPATARNDISCDLSLYFQSFDDFFKSRQNSISKKEYAFVDMVLYPDNRRQTKKQGETESFRKRDFDAGTKQEYDPSDYRIRADVGWNIPSESSRYKINEIARKQGLYVVDEENDYYNQLKDIINASNKSFYLTMVDHKMDIKDTGAVQIDINYRAYVETALKTNRFNALLDAETFRLKKAQKKAIIDAKMQNCTRQDLIKLRREIDRQNELITKNAHQSIMRRLIMRDKIFFVDVDEAQKNEFERIGYFKNRPKYMNYKKQKASELANADGDTKKRLKEASEADNINSASFTLTRDKWVDENVSKNIRVNYFFMGDLIYTILDVINDTELQPDLEKTKLLLGSFEYVDYDGRTRIANIADIPVSCDYFFEWYTQHVVKAKRQSFPIAYFVRTLCNHFITELLSDKCRNKSQVMKISFKTGTFMAAPHTAIVGNNTSLTKDPFYWMTTSSSTSAKKEDGLDRLVVQVGKYYDGTYKNNEASLPLTHYDVTPGVGTASTSQRFYQYMLVYPVVSPAMNHPGTGDELEDRKRGVHHIHIGGRTGVIKKVGFDRTDIQYIRESRFLNQGADGLLQLGAVYKATIDMVGNTLWFPGMELYINPLGIGGLALGFPNNSKSAANKLGLGGYHLITRIKSVISPGVYNTQVEAQFFYSGDGSIDKQRLGLVKEEKTPQITQADTLSNQSCQTIMDKLVAGTADLGGKLSRIDEESSYAERVYKETINAKTINDSAVLPILPFKRLSKERDADLEGAGLELEAEMSRKGHSKEAIVEEKVSRGIPISNEEALCVARPEYCCFVAETMVTMFDLSQKRIDEVNVGDNIMTINGPEKVIGIGEPLKNTLIKYSFDDGSSITGTMDHPLFVLNKGWASCHPNYSRYRYNIDTAQIKLKDKLLSLQNKQKTLESFEIIHAAALLYIPTYTLKTESQTFYANDLLVHSEI